MNINTDPLSEKARKEALKIWAEEEIQWMNDMGYEITPFMRRYFDELLKGE